MSDTLDEKGPVSLECPCCGALLKIDTLRGEVLEAVGPAAAARKAADLKDAQKLLAEESSRIDQKYRQIVEADKGRNAALDKMFSAFKEKTKDEPATKPVRDIDLD